MKIYRLPFLLESWVDGDTCHGTVDCGWGLRYRPPKGLRLLAADGRTYDAPERRRPTLAEAKAASARAEQLAPPGRWYMITSHRVDPDDFGRILCSLQLADNRDLATILEGEGHVKKLVG